MPELVDYIVIGGGTAGCVVAARLAEAADSSVVLLEAGGSDRSPIILAPAATDIYAIGNPKWDWRYMAESDSSRNGRRDMWPRGKVLGGSGSINGTIYIRGNRGDYDGWAALGNAGWSYEEVLPYFRKSEANQHGADAYRGADGPLHVTDPRSIHPLSHRFVKAAVEMGIPANDNLNGASQYGVGISQATQRRGWRHSTARAYLGPARTRHNLQILTRAQVTRVLFEGTRAVGVEYLRGGQARELRARCEVILSAGAIASPQLLMLSGVGPGARLQEHGVHLVHDLPGVGANLQEHCGAWLVYEVNQRTYNNDQGLIRQGLHGLNWLLFGRGPATTPGAQAIAFVHTRAAEGTFPDVQIHFTPAGYKFTPTQVELYREPAVTMVPNVSRPRTRGRIELRSADPQDAPRIAIDLLGDNDDMHRLIAASRLIRRIAAASSLREAVVREMSPGPEVQSDAQWEAFLRDNVVPVYHPAGTCKMGQDRMAVVDERLRVHGIAGLRVVDASIMPTLVSGNTNAPTIMIAEKASSMVLQDRARE